MTRSRGWAPTIPAAQKKGPRDPASACAGADLRACLYAYASDGGGQYRGAAIRRGSCKPWGSHTRALAPPSNPTYPIPTYAHSPFSGAICCSRPSPSTKVSTHTSSLCPPNPTAQPCPQCSRCSVADVKYRPGRPAGGSVLHCRVLSGAHGAVTRCIAGRRGGVRRTAK